MRKTASQIADEVLEKVAVSRAHAVKALKGYLSKAPTELGSRDIARSFSYHYPRTVSKAMGFTPTLSARAHGHTSDEIMKAIRETEKSPAWFDTLAELMRGK